MQQSWDMEDFWNVGLMTLFALGGYIPLLMNGLNSPASQLQFQNVAGSPFSRAVIAALCAACLIPIVRILPKLVSQRILLRPLLPYFVWAVASLAWSQDPAVSGRKLFSFVLTCAYAFYFAVRFPLRKQLSIVFISTSLLAFASILLLLLSPQNAIDHSKHVGAWQGVFAGKNGCAATMAVGLAAALAYRASSFLQRTLKFCMIVLFLGIIAKSDSSGTVVAIAVLLISIPIVKLLTYAPRKFHGLILPAVLVLAAVATFAAINYLPEILRLLHRDATLSGRTRLWSGALQAIYKRPWLGYGYGAFWLALKGESANVAFVLKWTPPHAHNGFLDICLSLGLVGFALFTYSLLCAGGRMWRLLKAGSLERGRWMVSVVILVITCNLGESNLILAPSLMWILYVAAVISLERFAVRKRSRVDAPMVFHPSLCPRPTLRPALLGPPSN
jgi:exopolysaccharide production protein ExoQ